MESMQTARPLLTLYLLVLLSTLTAICASRSLAQNADDASIDEIVVIGSRRGVNNVSTSPVPVDVLSGELFRSIGTADMDEVLRTLIPAYNVKRYSLNDESSLVRPATLRGLPPENTLILINGKRLHRSAVLAGVMAGAQGPDTSVIAPSAIGRVEVLRDGASAQYGSDAIAGVINFVTRDPQDGISVEYRLGQFYAGDGRSQRVSLNSGFALGERGIGSISLEYGNEDKTVRAEQRFDARALEDVGMQGIPRPAQSWGQPNVDDDWRLFASAELPVSINGEAYGFVHLASREPEIEFFWRNPNGQFGVYTFGPERLVFDLTNDGSASCPTAGSPNALPVPDFFFPSQEDYDADQAALQLLAANPDCWTVNERYPSGYRPMFGADISDWGSVIGYRHDRNGGFRYDVSFTAGESKVEYTLRNSLNPSLGPTSPTEFRPGGTRQREINLNLDAAKTVELSGLYSPLNVAAGLEWREESYRTLAGDPSSWEIGPLHTQGASIGSHGYPGYSPDNAGEWSRANWAAYLDLEADITERLLLALALRYEDFEDFGSTTNGKAALRFMFSDKIALRASASTGFRAPTPGQSNFTRLQTEIFDNELRQVGLIPSLNPVAQFYGGRALRPEESENLSAGIMLTPTDGWFITVDYFRIDVEDRIVVGPQFFVTPEDRQELIDLGVPGASDFTFIEFFGNNLGTRTEGFDTFVAYTRDWPSAGRSEISLAWNNTKVTPFDLGGPNRAFTVSEQNQPRNRVSLTLQQNLPKLQLLARLSYFDSYVIADTDEGPSTPICTDERPNPEGTDQCFGDAWVADIEAAYTFADQFTVIVGANNVFDTYPDKSYDYPNFSFGQIWHEGSPFGYNGGFWYLRLRADF